MKIVLIEDGCLPVVINAEDGTLFQTLKKYLGDDFIFLEYEKAKDGYYVYYGSNSYTQGQPNRLFHKIGDNNLAGGYISNKRFAICKLQEAGMRNDEIDLISKTYDKKSMEMAKSLFTET